MERVIKARARDAARLAVPVRSPGFDLLYGINQLCAQAYNPSTQEEEEKDHEFESIFCSDTSYMLA